MSEKELASLLEEIERLERRRRSREEEEKLKQARKEFDKQLGTILGQILAGDSEILVKEAEALGKYFQRNGLTTSQIRNIYAQVRTMRYDRNALNLLRPRLAYAAGRHKQQVSGLQRILDAAIIKVSDEEKFKNFQHFFEAILAYHKYYGGD